MRLELCFSSINQGGLDMNDLIEKYVLYTLKGAAVFSTFIVLLRMAFEESSSFYGLLLAIAGTLGILFLVVNALIFTNSKGLINYGAFSAMLIGLVIIATVIMTVLKGDDLDTVFTSGWDTVQYLTQILLAAIAGLYLATEGGARIHVVERIGLVCIIPAFMLVELISPYHGSGAFEGWDWEAVVAVVIVTVIMLGVLFFSNLVHSIAYPLTFALCAWVVDLANVKHFIFDGSDTSPTYDDYGYSDYSYGPSYSATTLLRIAVSTAFLIYCAWIVWRTRKNAQELV